jgi:malonyl CoA-acyl carrier protein transacylase
MKRESEGRELGMLAVRSSDMGILEQFLDVDVALINSPNQVVLSGEKKILLSV